MSSWEAEAGISAEEALTAALEAASKAGNIIWSSVQQRRAAAASKLIPTAEEVKAKRMAKAAEEAEQSTHTAGIVPAEEHGDGGAGVDAAKEEGTPIDLTAAAAAMVSPSLDVETKDSTTDLVTKYDKMCDRVIQDCLTAYCDRVQRESPNVEFQFITEELNPDVPLTDALTWIVDPIDGTMSFVHELPDCCVSIGLTYKKEPVVAVVFCPFLASGVSATPYMASFDNISRGPHTPGAPTSVLPHPALADLSAQGASRAGGGGASGSRPAAACVPPPQTASGSGRPECHGEVFAAIKDRGCYLNGMPVRVRHDAAPKDALLIFNFPFNIRLSPEEAAAEKANPGSVKLPRRNQAIDCSARIREEMLLVPVQSVRLYGSGVLSLAHIAAGRADGYLEPASSAWDVCAAALLITEAGGVVRNMKGEPFDMARDTTICAGANEALVTFMTDISNKEKYYEYWNLPAPAATTA